MCVKNVLNFQFLSVGPFKFSLSVGAHFCALVFINLKNIYPIHPVWYSILNTFYSVLSHSVTEFYQRGMQRKKKSGCHCSS